MVVSADGMDMRAWKLVAVKIRTSDCKLNSHA
jgi:hypothetical protein